MIKFIDLGLTDYRDAYRIQKDLLDKRIAGEVHDTVLLTEHRPVVTIGRRGSVNSIRDADELGRRGIAVEFVDRGGDVTYHGPGQLVVYPIVNLRALKKDIKFYIDMLEAFVVNFLSLLNLKGELISSKRGIFIKGKKIASVGIALKKWVAYHGISININLDLYPFTLIKICGHDAMQATSFELELGKTCDWFAAKEKAINAFRYTFKELYAKSEVSELAYKNLLCPSV